MTLYITEGAKKGLQAAQKGLACVALAGVDAWKAHRSGKSPPIPDLDKIAWKGRKVYVVCDSGFATKPAVTWCACSNSLAFHCMTAADSETTRGGPMLNSVPTLDELAAHPERASEIPPATTGALLARLAGVQTTLLARLLAPSGNGSEAAPVDDRLLTASEAARQLGHSKDWLYRHAARSSFTVRTGRDVRFSAAGLARWIRTRQER